MRKSSISKTFAKLAAVNLSVISSKNRTFGVEKREKVLFSPLFSCRLNLIAHFSLLIDDPPSPLLLFTQTHGPAAKL